MKTLSAAKRGFEPAAVRSVFVNVRPRPRRLSERRAILRTLQSFGEIEVFQSLADPASFNVVAANAVTRRQLIRKSPLQFEYVPEPPKPPGSIQTSTTGEVPTDIYRLHPATGPGDGRQTFTLSIFPSDTKHRHQIQKSPLYGPWPEKNNACGPVNSLVTSALKQLVPNDMAAKGLADWETGGQTLSKFDRGYSDRSELVGAIIERRIARRNEAAERGKQPKGTLLETFTE